LSIDLSTTPFAEVLWDLSAARQTGDLVIEAEGDARRTVYFDQGRLVAASSEDPRQRLGSYLLNQGRVSPGDLAQAERRIAAGSERRIGEALVAAGVLRRDEVGRAVARLTRQITLSVFPCTQGTVRFVEGEPSVPVEAMVGISLHRLLYVGIRGMRDADLIARGLGDLDRRVRLAPAPPFRFILRKCPPGELRILEQVRSPVAIRELVSQRDKPSPARVKAVYALFRSGVIEDIPLEDREPPPRPVAHIEANTFLLAEVEGPAGEPETFSLRLEVEQELAFSARLDTDSWIRVSSQHDVIRALEAKRRRYLGFLDRVGVDAGLQRDVETLIGRITVFLLRLSEPDPGATGVGSAATQTVPPLVRTRTDPPGDEAPRKIPVGKRPVRVGGDTGPQGRRAGDTGAIPRLDTGAMRRLDTGAMRRLDTGAMRRLDTGAMRRLDTGAMQRVDADSGSQAPGDPGGVASEKEGDPGGATRVTGSGPVPRVGGASGPQAGGSGPVPRAPSDDTGPNEAAPRRPEPISQLVRNGELRMSLNDFASATQIYRKLVERAPDVAGYRLRLAQAMARWPPAAREAEREFLEAVRRDPNNPRIHYHFGLYYKSMKLKSRAVEEMRTAVSLDPQNEGAREHLKDLSPGDPLLDDQSWGE